MKPTFRTLMPTALLMLGFAVSSQAQTPLYDIQFANPFSGDPDHPQTGAAVIGSSGDVWNYATNFNFTLNTGSMALANTSGSLTSATITYGGLGLDSNTANGFSSTAYAGLMSGYLFLYTGGPATISITGLNALSTYTIYLYTQGDNTADGRQLAATTGLSSLTAAPTDENASTFIAGQNYLVLSGETDGSGTLGLTYSIAADEADINGLQIFEAAPAPEPSTYALALAGASLLFYRRRK
ncbi:MAG TPA: PEP-CTERM sorting domain-containing protein [Verrucomicrobiae bacterium]|jgi:hypothetical protein